MPHFVELDGQISPMAARSRATRPSTLLSYVCLQPCIRVLKCLNVVMNDDMLECCNERRHANNIILNKSVMR